MKANMDETVGCSLHIGLLIKSEFIVVISSLYEKRSYWIKASDAILLK